MKWKIIRKMNLAHTTEGVCEQINRRKLKSFSELVN